MGIQDSKFQALSDFRPLRWQRETVLVGDGPDARTCTLFFSSPIRCFHCLDFIQFKNGKKFAISRQTIDGKRAYLFLYRSPLQELWRRRNLERELMAWLREGPIGEVQIMVEWITELAGHPLKLWPSREYLLSTAGDHVGNVGVPDLEMLAGLIGQQAGQPSRSAA